MSVDFSKEDVAFAGEVGAFARANLTDEVRRKVASELRPTKDEITGWQRSLHGRGWAAPAWPREHGGTGWSPARQYLFKREMGRALAPDPSPFGLQMIGPVLYTFGSEEQRRRYLPPILTGETSWCQGFSEPDAGSDLASLRTRARLDGEHYIVSGQKIWTSLAHWADMMFCLARTEEGGKPQAGISMLVFPMSSPGVTVRPIVTLDGHHHLNEVFLDDVRVPREDLIGEPGQGWTYAKFLLGHERIGIANIPRLRRRMNALLRLGRTRNARGEAPLADRGCRRDVAAFEADLVALEEAELRALRRLLDGEAGPADASILKIVSTELLQRADALLAGMLGPRAAILPGDAGRMADDAGALLWGVVPALLHGRAATIYGGSSEVQRNIIAATLLGGR